MGIIVTICGVIGGILGAIIYFRTKKELFNLTNFVIFIAFGAGICALIGHFIKEYGFYISVALMLIGILLIFNGSKTPDLTVQKKQYSYGGILLICAAGLFLLTIFDDANTSKVVTNKSSTVTNQKSKSKDNKKAHEQDEIDIDTDKYDQGISDAEIDEVIGESVKKISAGRNLDSDDLTIGDINIDAEVGSSSLLKKLGMFSSIKDNDGKTQMSFGKKVGKDYPIVITAEENRIDMIIVTSNIPTPRGIRASGKLYNDVTVTNASKRDQVINAYGSDYNKSSYEDFDLYEYKIRSKIGDPCILRFAVGHSNEIVHYISIRRDKSNTDNSNKESSKGIWLINLHGEDVYVKANSIERIDIHPDVAPEFRCVLIYGSGKQQNCEFKARGEIVMSVDGERVGTSSSNADIKVLYNAIVNKLLK